MDRVNGLRGIDLNLLVVLDALLEEAHVTRAARRLGLSQPAASNALDRLRHLFGDPLLERGRGGLRLTPLGEALRAPLGEALAALRDVLRRPGRNLATTRQTVRLLMADAPGVALLVTLQARLAHTAPGVTLALLPWAGAADALTRLHHGEADLVASVLPPLDPPLRQRRLLDETYCVVMRPGHPAAAEFDLARWLAFPHVVVSGHGGTETPLDAGLAARGLARRVGVVVPSFLMVPPLLAGSDLIAMLPTRCVPAGAALTVRPPPLPVEGFRLDLAWHDRRSGDPVVMHVAEAMAEALAADGVRAPPL
ncbi:LysR family transcriptional regulator [Belnapia sp. T18]|uniref:LysR family transcriptional regulator n=1 Tax=Belnapia arida TaxID=2804533 RepID=A0ABS1TVI8_9PROT|nr:LysR family transcriptional regulator [Belnapia arida]MBL6076457.1 LysR family transcriptional regulator [Belnapia arida]